MFDPIDDSVPVTIHPTTSSVRAVFTAIKNNFLALASSVGSSIVGYLPAGTGAVATTVEDALHGNRYHTNELSAFTILSCHPKTAGFENFDVTFSSYNNSGGGAGTYNHALFEGFNSGRHSGGIVTSGKPAILMGFEDNYYDNGGSNKYGVEWYIEYWSPDGTTQQMLRPFYCRVEGTDNNSASNASILHDIGSDGLGDFQVFAQGMGAKNTLLLIAESGNTLYGTNTIVPSGNLVVPVIKGNYGANSDVIIEPGSASGRIYILSNAGANQNIIIENNGNIVLKDAISIDCFGSTGIKILGSGSQKLGFYGATPQAQTTGYGTPTNVSKTANLPGTAASLAQVGGTLAALITELKANGLIGN